MKGLLFYEISVPIRTLSGKSTASACATYKPTAFVIPVLKAKAWTVVLTGYLEATLEHTKPDPLPLFKRGL